MALRSMTGFGRGEATVKGVRAVAELSTVNRRQLDIHVAMPRDLGSLDARIAEEVQGFIARGRLTGEIRIEYSDRIRKKSIHVDESLAATYLQALRQTAKGLKLADDLTASLLLTLPDVIRYDSGAEHVELAWPALRKALRAALRGLAAMRREEGKALEADLGKRLDAIASHLGAIETRAPGVVAGYRQALMERLAAHEVSLEDDDDRLMREIALFADRCDIAEEITRLKSHLDQARTMMRSTAATGKSLDFLAQEMFREINTIGSKANDSGIAHRVVACKTELERFREQVQNIE